MNDFDLMSLISKCDVIFAFKEISFDEKYICLGGKVKDAIRNSEVGEGKRSCHSQTWILP